jgi:thiol:disulfide interchange protein DsbD
MQASRYFGWIFSHRARLPAWTLAGCAVLALAAGLRPAPARATSGDAVTTDHVKARLLVDVQSVAPGQTFSVGLEFVIQPGWHTYWRNPGDSGLPTKLAWTLPPGLVAGVIEWPAPHRFDLPPLVNYGYAGHVLHLVPVTAASDLATAAPLVLRAKAGWLVCADICVPESAELQVTVPASTVAGTADAAVAGLFAEARHELPVTAPAATLARIADGRLVLELGRAWDDALQHLESLSFVPEDDGVVEYAAPQTSSRKDGALELASKLGFQPPTTGPVRGLLLVTGRKNGASTTIPYTIAASLAGGTAAPGTASTAATPLPAGTPSPAAPASPAGSRASADGSVPPGEPVADSLGLGALLLLAALGGLVLNLMPCVFPVLSIKAISLAAHAEHHPAAVRAKGLVFAAGVVASMLALAVILLALRAGGEQIGWGFQLQSPLFVTLMAYLLFAVGLNLSGVFEFGGGLAGIGDALTRGDSYHAAFFTGVLTTLVATPCTAPFMAAAVGAALTQSPLVALAIFTALGLGLALPYVLLSFAPWLRRALPRPGPWMDVLKQVFAFPMYASAAWLLWVLAQQSAELGLAGALAGAVMIGLAAWAYQKSKSARLAGRRVLGAAALVALLAAIALPLEAARTAAAAPVASGASRSRAADEWQPYDAVRVAQLAAAGRPVLVNFTASWCLTCLVNERNAFADADVRAVFRDKGVTLMKGDWTNRDPEITKALAAFGRAGVPLYVVYNGTPGTAGPELLPQLLSAGVVREAFAALPQRELK